MRRWTRRILFTLVAFVVVLIVAVQIVLSTNLPRNVLISTLERQLGLRVTASSLSVGWFGHTTVKDVTLALPLSDQSFLKAEELSVRNTTIPCLLLGGKMQVNALVFKRPSLLIRQDPTGRWNVQEVIALLGRAGGGQAAEKQPDTRTGALQLPSLAVEDATIILQDRTQKKNTITPVNISGTPDGLLVWRLTASIGPTADPALAIDGNFAPGGSWEHHLNFHIQHPDDLLRSWFPNGLGTLQIKGAWAGRLANGGTNGQLRIESGQFQNIHVGGNANIEAVGGKVTFRPAGLHAQMGAEPAQLIAFVGGSVTYEGTILSMDDVVMQLMGGSARINGKADTDAKSAKFDSQWVNVAVGTLGTHEGNVHVSYTTPWPGQAKVEAGIHSKGFLTNGGWQADLKLTGEGKPGGNFDWDLTAPKLHWDGSQHIHLDNIQTTLQQRGQVLALRDLHTGIHGQLGGEVSYDLNSRAWWSWLSIHDLPLLRRSSANTNIELHVTGDAKHIDVNQLDIFSGQLGATAFGYYRWNVPKPLKLTAEFWRAPFHINEQHHPREALGGELWGHLNTEGDLQPAALSLELDVEGDNVIIGQRKLGSPKFHLSGSADDNHIALKSTQIEVLDGQWTLALEYIFETDQAKAHLTEKEFPLTAMDDILSPAPRLNGIVSADVDLVLPDRDLKHLAASGDWHIAHFKKIFAPGQAAQTTIAANTIDGQISYKDGSLKLNEIVAKNGESRLNLMAQLDQVSQNLRVVATSNGWPVDFPQLALKLNVQATSDLRIDLNKHSITGPLWLSTPVTYKKKSIGTLMVDSQLIGRALQLDDLTAEVLEGRFNANGTFLFDDRLNSSGSYKFDDINLAYLPQWVADADGIAGKISGWGLITPDHDPRVPGPLRLNFSMYPAGGHFRELTFGDMDIVAYAGKTHLSIDRSKWDIAGGNIHLNGRLTSPLPTRPREKFAQANLTLHDIDVNQVVKAFDTDTPPEPGRLDGSFSMFGPLDNKTRMFGDGDLTIRKTDLLNVGFISFLYDALGLKWGPLKPDGSGHIAMRLESDDLHITQFSYFNRGVEVRGNLDVKNVWKSKIAALDGYAVGSARPLRSIKLPLIADAEKILSVLEQNVTTVKITGTLAKPKPKLVPFSDVGSGLRRFLLGDVSTETKGSAG